MKEPLSPHGIAHLSQEEWDQCCFRFVNFVAVVGSSHKVAFCSELGADIVIDKSQCPHGDIWTEVKRASPGGYIAVFDATGVETLTQSYNHLAQCGRSPPLLFLLLTHWTDSSPMASIAISRRPPICSPLSTGAR